MVRRRGGRWLGALLIVMAIAAVGVFGGAYLAERWANQRKDQAIVELQARLGRPVTAGKIEVSWLGGFVVRTGGIEIGAAPGEPGPALRVDQARLRVGLTRALFSLGKRVHVKEAVLSGITANVVRFPDGTLNWDQIAARLRTADRPSQPMSEAMRERLRGLVVERARLDDAQVKFVDLGKGAARAEVSDLDLEVSGASLRDPFTVRLTAAVASRQKNLDVALRFVPPPPGGDRAPAPLPARAEVRLQPVELAPLAPFLGRGPLGALTEGKLAANLVVDLGAAVPGGQGPTLAKGDVHLTGARLAQGERFDGVLASDVVADTAAGNVTVNKLRLALGEMVLSSSGKLLDLRSAPRFDNFTVSSQGLDFDTLRRYYPPLEKSAGVALAGPFTVSASASAEGGSQRFAARADLTRASLAVPGQLDKPAGMALTFETSGRAEGKTVHAERLVFVMGDARIEGRGILHPAAKDGRPFEATLEAEPFALRQIAALVGKADGLADIRLGAKVRARGTLGRPESMQVQVPSFTASSGASQIAGSLTVQNLDRPQVTLDGKARFLDLDDFLPARRAGEAAPARARRTQPAGPPSLLARAQGRAKLAVERGRAAGIDYQDLKADLSLADARLRAHALEVGAFGGKFSGAGSELPLEGEEQPFVAKGTIAAMDVSALLARFAPGTKVLRGALSADIDLSGRGTRPIDLQRTLTGKLSGGVANAEFLPTPLLEPVVKALSHAVKVPALASLLAQAEARVAALRDRGLGDLAGAVQFAEGVLEIARPLEAKARYGALSLGGKIRLDGRTDLAGTVALAPEVVSAILGGKATVDEPLPIKLRLTGPIRSPRVSPAELEAPARVLATAFARTAVAQEARTRLEQTAGKVTEGKREQIQEGVEKGVEKAREAAGRRLRRVLPR